MNSFRNFSEAEYRRAAINIRRLRKQKGWSQLVLAREAGVGATSVWRAEDIFLKSVPKYVTFYQIALALGVSYEDLFVEEELWINTV